MYNTTINSSNKKSCNYNNNNYYQQSNKGNNYSSSNNYNSYNSNKGSGQSAGNQASQGNFSNYNNYSNYSHVTTGVSNTVNTSNTAGLVSNTTTNLNKFVVDNSLTYDEKLDQMDPLLLQTWKNEQNRLKQLMIHNDDFSFSLDEKDKSKPSLTLVGGVDLSFCHDKNKAIAAITVIDAFNFDIVYEKYELVTLTQPYVPGFLAFREVDHLVKLIDGIKKDAPQFLPQVILVDGNGILHKREFGLACHLGVLTGIPCIGCAKTIFAHDGINQDYLDSLNGDFKSDGDFVYLEGYSKKTWAIAYKCKLLEDPIIISQGHKISLDSAMTIVSWVSDSQVPIPVKLADGRSRVLASIYNKTKKFDPDYFQKNPNMKDYGY